MIQTKPIYANAVISQDENDLQDIHLKSKNIAIYQRDINALKAELNQLSNQSISCKVTGTIDEILSSVKKYFEDIDSPTDALLQDISQILNFFGRTTKASSFRLLLATVKTNMCRKFHTDVNDIRLLCTYVGQGTLWLPDEAVNEKALVMGGDNDAIVKDEKFVQQVATGDVVLLKGGLYPDAVPILHRSPTIEEFGETRLLLRIDTNEFLSFLNED